MPNIPVVLGSLLYGARTKYMRGQVSCQRRGICRPGAHSRALPAGLTYIQQSAPRRERVASVRALVLDGAVRAMNDELAGLVYPSDPHTRSSRVWLRHMGRRRPPQVRDRPETSRGNDIFDAPSMRRALRVGKPQRGNLKEWPRSLRNPKKKYRDLCDAPEMARHSHLANAR